MLWSCGFCLFLVFLKHDSNFRERCDLLSLTEVKKSEGNINVMNNKILNVSQITFDVINVRKLLLSTSALKHRGLTINFNHDCDRIIFRNETVNLVSHESHSYLHVQLYGHLVRKGNLRKSFWKYGWEKVCNWECFSFTEKKGYSYLCMWMTSNWPERNKILIRCGKYSIEVDLGEPTSFHPPRLFWLHSNTMKEAKML